MKVFGKIFICISIIIVLFISFLFYDINSLKNNIENNNKIIEFHDSDNIYLAVEIKDSIENAVVYDKDNIKDIDYNNKVIILIDDKLFNNSKVSAGGIFEFEKSSLVRYLKTSEIDTPLRNYITLYSGNFKILAFGLLMQDISNQDKDKLLDYYNDGSIKVLPDRFSFKLFRILPRSLQVSIINSIVI